MNAKSVEFLRDYNDWRRGSGRYDQAPGFAPGQPCAAAVGEAIDWACEQIDQVRSAVLGYYAAIDRREHGGVAQDKAFRKIEEVLGMHWEQGASLRSDAPLPPPPGETKMSGPCPVCRLGDCNDRHREYIARLQAQRDELRAVCAEAYQMAGALGAPVKALDNLSAAASGDPLPHATFLPVDTPDVMAQRDELLRLLKESRATLEMWKDVAPAVSLCADMDAAIESATKEPT